MKKYCEKCRYFGKEYRDSCDNEGYEVCYMEKEIVDTYKGKREVYNEFPEEKNENNDCLDYDHSKLGGCVISLFIVLFITILYLITKII